MERYESAIRAMFSHAQTLIDAQIREAFEKGDGLLAVEGALRSLMGSRSQAAVAVSTRAGSMSPRHFFEIDEMASLYY